ncbi:MAG TPA: presqualene diphosphate synthase HpnD [Stellaceae bacterium]|nr:presqualene diphosphate synthase HpnD [Stellaceae bacterium]
MSGTAYDNVGAVPDEGALRAAIRQKVEAAGTSFYWAMRLLPSDRRNGMYAVYAFCREVDDIADDLAAPPAAKIAALGGWHAEIDALYAGRPRHLVACALREPVMRYALRRNDFHAVIDGMEMDAAGDIRAPDLATLDLYCGRVAAAVGHLSVHVFGDAREAAHSVADSLGRALQLTNILRDLEEDAERGRLYLPRELLEAHRIAPTAEPLAVLRHPALPAVCRDLAAIAERHFGEADAAMARCSRRAMRPAALMAAFYHAILAGMQRADWREPAQRIRLSKAQKLRLVLRHGLV